jgi:hypothetical protein
VLATSTVLFNAITSVRPLSDGRVLVNDGTGHRLVLLDAGLTTPTIVMDSVQGRTDSYGTAATTLLAHLADSSMIVDRSSKTFVVIDPAGHIARTMSLPPPSSSYLFLSSPSLYGAPGVSAALGIVYESPILQHYPRRPPGSPDTSVFANDTSGVFAFNLANRRVDTLARFSNGGGRWETLHASGLPIPLPAADATSSSRLIQFRFSDQWALRSDGSVAVVRSRDYRLDMVGPDRNTTVGPRIAHEWIRNTDADKVRMVDSMNALTRKSDSTALARFIDDSTAVAQGTATPAQISRMKVSSVDIAGLSSLTLIDLDAASIRSLPTRTTDRKRPTPGAMVATSDIPDFMPVFDRFGNSVLADADTNVWIHGRASPGKPSPWDVVDRRGVLVDRVIIPAGRTIVGFAPGGIIYLSRRVAGGAVPIPPPLTAGAPRPLPPPSTVLERVQWKK